ncbi:IS1380-Spn1 transposase [Streptococcus pneumoniae]|nr:IS1380-Spn1 transposase [Streptococcus pneumoniae]
MNRLVNDSRKCEILLFKISIIVVSVIVLVMSIVGAYYFKNCLWDKESLNLTLTLDTLFAVFITFFSFSNDKSSNIFGISPNEIIRTQSEVYQFLFTKSFATLLIVTNLLSIIHYFGAKNLIVSFNETYPRIQSSVGIMWLPLFGILIIYFIWLLIEGLKYIRKINYIIQNREIIYFYSQVKVVDKLTPQLFTPNLKTIQNPCLSLDPGWFLFSPNGCFLLDKKEFPLYGISVEKNTKRKETHMNSLPNHHFQNKSFYQLSFDGGHLTQYGGLIFFQELFSQLKLKERISKYLVTNDQRRYCRYSDSDILVQFLFQLLTGYGTDYACKELSADAYFPKLLEGGQLASQPTLSRFLSRTDEETVHSLRCLNLELVEFFLQFHQLNQLIVDIDSTHFTTYGKQEGVAYNAHYRAHGYHPLYAFEGKTGYCFNAQLRPGNRYCSEEADSFITPVLERFNQLLFRMDSGFATPKLYDLIEKTGQYYLIKLKKNTVLSRLGDLSLPCPQDEDLTILPHSAYSETLYQAGSWSHKRRVCQFSERKEGNLFYDVISLVTNMTSGTSQDQFQLYRGRGQAENFIKEMKEGFFGDKTDSSTLIKNEVRMMMSCIAYNLYLFLKHLAGGDFQTLTIKRFRHLFLHVVGKCVRTGRKQLLKLSSLYAYSELFSALYSRIRKVNLNLPVPYEPPRRKASLMMH